MKYILILIIILSLYFCVDKNKDMQIGTSQFQKDNPTATVYSVDDENYILIDSGHVYHYVYSGRTCIWSKITIK